VHAGCIRLRWLRYRALTTSRFAPVAMAQKFTSERFTRTSGSDHQDNMHSQMHYVQRAKGVCMGVFSVVTPAKRVHNCLCKDRFYKDSTADLSTGEAGSPEGRERDWSVHHGLQGPRCWARRPKSTPAPWPC
jgi:hypothetical protein